MFKKKDNRYKSNKIVHMTENYKNDEINPRRYQ